MIKTRAKTTGVWVRWAVGLVMGLLPGDALAQSAEWRHYGGDLGGQRFSSLSQNLTQTIEGLFLQRDKGRMDAESWAAIERRSQTLFSARGLQQWWLIRGFWFTDSFQDYMNQLIADLDEKQSYAQFFDRPE